jgi:hypothetical protein
MNSKLCLRAAGMISLLLAAGHALGNPWLPVPNDQRRALVDAMSAYHFDVLGSSHSYRDFHVGFGWMLPPICRETRCCSGSLPGCR